jgi:hypothetical protein
MSDLAPPISPYSETPIFTSKISPPNSLYYDRLLVELLEASTLLQNGLSSAEVTQESDNRVRSLKDLLGLAACPWFYGSTLPDPIVGKLESDPGGIADRLGAKGMSVYMAFVEMESLRFCVCGKQSSDLALALLRQRHARDLQHLHFTENRPLLSKSSTSVASLAFPNDYHTRNSEHILSLNPTIALRPPDGVGIGWSAPSARVRVPDCLLVEPAHCKVDASSDAPALRNAFQATTSTITNPISSGTSAADDLLSSSWSSQRNDVLDPWQQPSGPSHPPYGTTASANSLGAETAGEDLPEIGQVVPGKGPTTGGSPVVILGHAFPCMPLYVRFGDAVTRAVGSGLPPLRKCHS